MTVVFGVAVSASSNAQMEGWRVFRSRGEPDPAMQMRLKRSPSTPNGSAVDSRGRHDLVARFAGRAAHESRGAVMLHLRSLYVSKSAILTISALSVPVENRSPA